MNLTYWADQVEPGEWFIRFSQNPAWLIIAVIFGGLTLCLIGFAISDFAMGHLTSAIVESFVALILGLLCVLVISPWNTTNTQPLYQERTEQANTVLIEKYGASLALSSPPLDNELQPDTIYETGKEPNGTRDSLLFNIPGEGVQTCVLSTSDIPKNLTILCGTPLTEPPKLKTWKGGVK